MTHDDGDKGFFWHQPVAVRFGCGCIDEVVTALGPRPVIVLGYDGAREQAWQHSVARRLGDHLLDWIDVRDGMATLAQARTLNQRVMPLAVAHADAVLLGIGGGTVLDLAKLLRCRPMALHGAFETVLAALRGMAPWPALRPMPLWLAPTTAGTGSEVTRWATLWDTDGEMAFKRSLDEPWGHAERAFIDPVLALSCPAPVTRDSALDALSHALESIWNRHANPVSDSLALAAARRVIATLPLALLQPDRRAHREQLALAALEAGLAFSQTRTALAHALSYQVTLEQGVPHGLACALWLPIAWRLAAGRQPRVDRLLGAVFDVTAADGALSLAQWLQDLGVQIDPAAWGIDDAPARIRAALDSTRGRNFIGAEVAA